MYAFARPLGRPLEPGLPTITTTGTRKDKNTSNKSNEQTCSFSGCSSSSLQPALKALRAEHGTHGCLVKAYHNSCRFTTACPLLPRPTLFRIGSHLLRLGAKFCPNQSRKESVELHFDPVLIQAASRISLPTPLTRYLSARTCIDPASLSVTCRRAP